MTGAMTSDWISAGFSDSGVKCGLAKKDPIARFLLGNSL
jgi:hypothetical protein